MGPQFKGQKRLSGKLQDWAGPGRCGQTGLILKKRNSAGGENRNQGRIHPSRASEEGEASVQDAPKTGIRNFST